MKKMQSIIAFGAAGLALTVGAAVVEAQSSDVLCLVSARGAIADGDEFFGHTTINIDNSVNPGGIWRHFVPGPKGGPEEVFVGMAETGTCVPNGRTIASIQGLGRYTGRPVNFNLTMRDGDFADTYTILIVDSFGTELLFANGDLVSGDISVIVP